LEALTHIEDINNMNVRSFSHNRFCLLSSGNADKFSTAVALTECIKE